MTQFVQCDNCGKTDPTHSLNDAFHPWYIVSMATTFDKHFHSLECLREWFSPEACTARVTKRRRMTDDELLASIARKILTTADYLGAHNSPDGPFLRIDSSFDTLTAEEINLIRRLQPKAT